VLRGIWSSHVGDYENIAMFCDNAIQLSPVNVRVSV